MLLITFVFLVGADSLHSARIFAGNYLEESPIIFPKSIEDMTADDDIPEPCREQTYCTIRPKNFPEQIFNEILKYDKHTSAAPQPLEVIEIHNRFENDEGKDDCEVEIKRDPIYKVKAIGDERWRTVVQAPQLGFVQRVRTERCLNPKASCFQIYTPVPNRVTFCHQEHTVFEVLVQKDNNQTEQIQTKLPTCCSCRYKKINT